MFNYNHLYYFYITAKSGGVCLGAKNLSISQPSLTSQLKVLEAALNLRLFHKVGRTNQLTENGLIVYGICQKAFETFEELDFLVSNSALTNSRRLHIGMSDQVGQQFVTDILRIFLKRYPRAHQPRILFSYDKHHHLLERLRFHELDAMITHLTMIGSDLVNLAEAQVPVTLLCPNNFTIYNTDKDLTTGAGIMESIGDTPSWIGPSAGLKFRAECSQFFADKKLKGKIVFESSIMSSLIQAVEDGIGLAFLPCIYAAKEIRKKTVHIIGPKEGYWKYPIWLACHSRDQNDALIQKLHESFIEAFQQSLI